MEEQKVKGREVYQTYFTTFEDNDELHRCNECSRDIKQNLIRGYVNLVNHVTSQAHRQGCGEVAVLQVR